MATYVAQPQTSRAGLITTIIILIVLNGFVAFLFFTKDSENRKNAQDLADVSKKYAEAVAAPTAPSSEQYGKDRDQAKSNNETVYDLKSQQVKALSALVAGQPVESPQVMANGQVALTQANSDLTTLGAKAGVKAPAVTDLVDAATAWTPIVTKLLADREAAAKDLESAKSAAASADAANLDALKKKDTEIAAAKDETAKKDQQIATLTQENDARFKSTVENSAAQAKTDAAAIQQSQTQLAALNTELTGLNTEKTRLQAYLRRFKAVPAIINNSVRQPDGIITAVTSADECFINLGEGDQISPGITFEVYDANKGIPPLESDNSPTLTIHKSGAAAAALAGVPGGGGKADRYEFDMPKGKGSIEVTFVGPGHQSRCKIIHVEPGQTIAQGDLIGNLVYDRNVKFNFLVYGDFDLNSDNPNSRGNDQAVIKRLIEQWGGQVQPVTDPKNPGASVTPNTDYIIIGREPVVPTFTADEAALPENQAAADRAKAKLDAYRTILDKAHDYGIPVLNQNRFLYYVGYYDQRRR